MRIFGRRKIKKKGIVYIRNLIIYIPPNNKIVKTIAKILKYLSMKYFIDSPNFFIRNERIIKRLPLPTMLAKRNKVNSTLKAPALIVNSLKGIGVKPAVKMIKKLYFS
tara:strand:+ start:358 stop:681 length:324 start_codon:yes stop_codon:yes gene_type:complete